MRTGLVLATAVILMAAAYAQAVKIVGVNPAVLDMDVKVLAKVWVVDLEKAAQQAGLSIVKEVVNVKGRGIGVVKLSGRGLMLQGIASGAAGILYYKGPAKALKPIVESPYTSSIFVKVIPEVPPISFFRRAVDLEREGQGMPIPNLPVIREIIGASRVEQLYDVNGTGIVIAVVDTGVDYGHPDLQGSLAWLIRTAGGGEITASDVWLKGSILHYKDLRGVHGQLPYSSVASVEPLVLDADESQVILFQDFAAVGNAIVVGSSTFLIIDGPFINSTSPPCNSYEISGLNSKSGIYKFGVTLAYSPNSTVLRKPVYVSVGVIMYDPDMPGVYTAARVDLNHNCVFEDDVELNYVGNRLIVDNLASPRKSLGVAGGYFYDWGEWFDSTARLYEGWDLSGGYLSIFYDFHGHGTAAASMAASRGNVVYNLGLLGPQRLRGIAAGSKVLGVKGLWWGLVEPGMMWAAGFSVDYKGQWYWTGRKRAHIISNSWGISLFIYDYAGFGLDLESAFVNGLAAPRFLDPNYPGIVIVQAGGNGGYGYGTITSPGAAAGVITLGAATSSHFLNALNQPYALRYGDIVSWSLRGPTPTGYPKPDVVNIGAFGIAAFPVGWGALVGHPGEDWDFFGGTSQATPLTAGVAALVLSSISSAVDPEAVSPSFVKQVILSTAMDVGYTPFTAGHGLVNATAAVTAARAFYNLQAAKAPVALFSSSTPLTVGGSWAFQWRENIPIYFGYLVNNVLTQTWINYIQSGTVPTQSFPSTYIYLGGLSPGSTASASLTISNPTNYKLSVTLQAVELKPIYRATAQLTVPVNTSSLYIPIANLFDESTIEGADLVVFRMSYLYQYLDPTYDYKPLIYPVLGVYGLVGNTRSWYNIGYPTGTAVEVPVARLGARIAPGETLLLRVRATPYPNVWPGYPSSVPVLLEVVAYRRVPASDLSVSPTSALIGPKGSSTFTVTVKPAASSAPTAFERMLVVTINGTGYVVPVVYTVSRSVTPNSQLVLTAGKTDSWYNAGEWRGAIDWDWRYESGDWRAFYVSTSGPTRGLLADFRWTCANTSMVVYVLTGDGFFAGYFWNQGVSYHNYLSPPSWNWSVFPWVGTAGMRRIVTMASSSFAVPVEANGIIYSTMSASYPVSAANSFIVLARTSLYGGCSASEDIRGVLTAFKSASDPVPTTLSPPLISFTMSSPPLGFLFAIKSAYVLGGGFVVPSFSVSSDLNFWMVYVRNPLFLDYIALLYSPQYATYVRYGNSFNTYPLYVEEGVSVIG